MTKVALKGLLGRKLRAALTAFAIVLGVAMVSGTYILTDTIKSAFDDGLHPGLQEHRRGRQRQERDRRRQQRRRTSDHSVVPESLLAQMRGAARRRAGAGRDLRLGAARRPQRQGDLARRRARPGVQRTRRRRQRFNPLTLTTGTWPSGPRRGRDRRVAPPSKTTTASADTIGVVARGPVAAVPIVGHREVRRRVLARRRDDGDLRPARPRSGCSTSRASSTRSRRGASRARRRTQLVERDPAAAAAGSAGQDRPGSGQAGDEGHQRLPEHLQDFLLAFGGVALFVGSFVIANTLSITIAQRTRELATLRTLGATRRQVLRSVLLEALVIGVLASVVGLFLGLGARQGPERAVRLVRHRPAAGRHGLRDAHGRSSSLARRDRRHAARGAPPGAARDARAADRGGARGRASCRRRASRASAGRGRRRRSCRRGRADARRACSAAGCPPGVRLLSLGLGAVALFIGVAMLAPTLVPPLAAVLGWPARRFGGAAGQLARGNATRNPSAHRLDRLGADDRARARHAGRGARGRPASHAFRAAVDKLFMADYASPRKNNFSPISDRLRAARCATCPGCTVVSGVRAGDGQGVRRARSTSPASRRTSAR